MVLEIIFTQGKKLIPQENFKVRSLHGPVSVKLSRYLINVVFLFDQDVHHFQLWHGQSLLWYHTKFRPGIQSFLEKVSKLFELHICTFGVRMYAHTIARLMDPGGKLFSHRILSRDECFNPSSKTANLK